MRLNFLNKFCIKIISRIYFYLQEEYINLNEFENTNFLTNKIQEINEVMKSIGKVFFEANNRFLFIDSLINNIIDIFNKKFKNNNPSLSKLNLNKIIEFLSVVYAKDIQIYFKLKYDFFNKPVGNLVTKIDFINEINRISIYIKENNLIFKEKISDSHLLQIYQTEINEEFKFNRCSNIDKFDYFLCNVLEKLFREIKILRKKIQPSKPQKEIQISLKLFVSKIKEILNFFHIFSEKIKDISQQIVLFTHFFEVIKKVCKLKDFMKNIKKQESSVDFNYYFIEKELKVNLIDFLISYRTISNKLRKTFRGFIFPQISIFSQSDNKQNSFKTQLSMCQNSFQQILNNLNLNAKINKKIEKYHLIENYLNLFVEETVFSINQIYLSSDSKFKNFFNQNFKFYLDSISKYIEMIESMNQIKIKKEILKILTYISEVNYY